jgi:integrase
MEKVATGIYLTTDGRYYVHATAKDPYSAEIVHRRETLDEGADLDAAKTRRAALVAEIRSRRPQPATDRPRVIDYAEQWLRRKCRPPRALKPSAAEAYTVALERFTVWGRALHVDEVTRLDVVAYRDHLQASRRADGRAYTTASLGAWWRPVVSMLRDAVADGYLERDPTYRLDAPTTARAPARERRTLSARELAALVDAARRVCPGRSAEITMLAYTGMRSGELWALQWGDVDFAGPRIHVHRSVSLGEVTESTKTGHGREVYMPDVVGWALLEHAKERETPSDGLVFPGDGGMVRQRGSLTKALRLARKAAGIEQRVSPQVLRRSFNDLLRASGVDWVVLQAQMGHSSDEMTGLYSGVRLEEKRGAVLRLVKGGR